MVTQPVGLGGAWGVSSAHTPFGSQSLVRERRGRLRDDGNEGEDMLDSLSSWKPLKIPNKGCEMRPCHSKNVLKISGWAKLLS